MSLKIQNLSVNVGEKKVLSDVSCEFLPGTVTYLVGKNGSGKSSLALSILGYSQYQVSGGDIILDNASILSMSITERAKKGLFLAMQNIPEIPGLGLAEFLRTIYNEHLKNSNSGVKPLTPFVFGRFILPFLKKLGIPVEFLSRDLNVGFSGGEKRKIEMLQIELLSPKYIFVDEIDSGLDIDAQKVVMTSLASYATPERSLIIITHNYRFAEVLPPTRVFRLEQGSVIRDGSSEVLKEIESEGF